MEIPELPDELWLDIFDRLGDRDFCKKIPRVCRRWNELAHNLRGTCVTITSIEDIRVAARLSKMYVVHLKTDNLAPRFTRLKPIKGLPEGPESVFTLSMAAGVFYKATHFYISGVVIVSWAQCIAFNRFQLRTLPGGAIDGPEIDGPGMQAHVLRNGDLFFPRYFNIELPALAEDPIAHNFIPTPVSAPFRRAFPPPHFQGPRKEGRPKMPKPRRGHF